MYISRIVMKQACQELSEIDPSKAFLRTDMWEKIPAVVDSTDNVRPMNREA